MFTASDAKALTQDFNEPWRDEANNIIERKIIPVIQSHARRGSTSAKFELNTGLSTAELICAILRERDFTCSKFYRDNGVFVFVVGWS